MNNDYQSDQDREDFEIAEEFQPKPKSRLRKMAFGFWILFLLGVLVVVGGGLVYKTGFTYDQMSVDDPALDLGDISTPKPQSDRMNILLMGLRGEEDPNGGLLTDSIMVVSVKKSTDQVALISIPRDLYVTMPGQNYKEKINAAYALGYEKKGAAGALLYSKIAVSQATGLYIDKAISVNHEAFQDVVDVLGGVDIHLDQPFIEYQQWTKGGDVGSSPYFTIETINSTTTKGAKIQRWVFKIPAGNSHLDGKTALYFVRARYSSNDFERVRRQQLVFAAIKDKALSVGFLGNPVKLFQALTSLGKNVRTDFSWSEMMDMVSLAEKVDTSKIIHKVFDTSPEGLLVSGKAETGAYILIPAAGSSDFSQIQETCQNIFGK